MKEVSEGLNDMYTVVVDIISSVARVADMVAPSVVTKNLVTKIDLDQLRVVLSKGLKDIHGHRYWGDLCGCVCGHTSSHGLSLWT